MVSFHLEDSTGQSLNTYTLVLLDTHSISVKDLCANILARISSGEDKISHPDPALRKAVLNIQWGQYESKRTILQFILFGCEIVDMATQQSLPTQRVFRELSKDIATRQKIATSLPLDVCCQSSSFEYLNELNAKDIEEVPLEEFSAIFGSSDDCPWDSLDNLTTIVPPKASVFKH